MSPSDPPPQAFEPRPDAHALTTDSSNTNNGGEEVDYEPDPEKSIWLASAQDEVVEAICRLYSAQPSEEDMQVYDEHAIYDDPYSYCDTRYKIAGQWYGAFFFLVQLQLFKIPS